MECLINTNILVLINDYQGCQMIHKKAYKVTRTIKLSKTIIANSKADAIELFDEINADALVTDKAEVIENPAKPETMDTYYSKIYKNWPRLADNKG